MWTNENRGRYERSRLRYPRDLTDEEWGGHFTAYTARQAGRQQADGGDAGGRQWADVHCRHRMPMGVAAKGLDAAQHGG